MKPGIVFATCAVALSVLGVGPEARAVDVKRHHGSDCKVFGSTAWTDLAFSGYGVKNLQSGVRQVICPVTMDSESSWDGTESFGAGIKVYVETGQVDAAVTCTAYVTSNNPAVTTVNTYTYAFGRLAANTAAESFLSTGLFSSVPGGIYWEDKIYMLCTLGPQVRLKGYFSLEYGATA